MTGVHATLSVTFVSAIVPMSFNLERWELVLHIPHGCVTPPEVERRNGSVPEMEFSGILEIRESVVPSNSQVHITERLSDVCTFQ